ncbi:uncharacterized protein LOC108740708 isoform X4 [Agrilus planipennis]|uniref:Uncharacterized protein LOC108740708 isoform X4 n=1 Tax=Agrilus planipennis TaxID=224129 RepID=A0A1W4X3E5_AGRPL|nr:uncharacterized protein LOC108740708 isoform X4 [Agrilus planipennis]
MENNDLKKWSLSMNDILKKIPSNIARAINEENQVYLQQLVKRSVRDLQQIASFRSKSFRHNYNWM